MTHTSDKLRKRFEAVWYTIPGIIPPEYKEEMWDLLETAIKDRESAGRVTKINGKTYVEINGEVDEIEIISNAQVHRLSLHTDTNSENK